MANGMEELWTRFQEWLQEVQKDAPMDLWLQAVILLFLCAGFNATSWLLGTKKASGAAQKPSPPKHAEAPSRPSPKVREVEAPEVKRPGPSVLSELRGEERIERSEAKASAPTPILTFDGLDFDGDRIVNLRARECSRVSTRGAGAVHRASFPVLRRPIFPAVSATG
ncbi:unnamed protein product [Durusdinium trenchii]|uniref:Uncharacterized protein n=1 Tax=Durusdinium trenchii TaxID=1381693 RepID=A0ABP0LNX2_9DINO